MSCAEMNGDICEPHHERVLAANPLTTVFFTWQWCLGHNLSMIGGAFASFRAGDKYGFHMGEDVGLCTCQWRPGTGNAYVGATPCIEGDPPAHDDDRLDSLDEVSW